MKKYLLLFFLLLPTVAFSQGSRFDSNATRSVQGFLAPIAGATITVCTSAGTGTPCTPVVPTSPVTLCTDSSCTVAAANSFLADSNGNFGFWALPGSYKVSITATGVTGQLLSVTLPCVAGTSCLTNPFDISVSTLKNSSNIAGHVPRNNGTQYVDAVLGAADLSDGVTGTGAVVRGTSPVINGTPSGTGIPTIFYKKGSGITADYTGTNTTLANVDTTNLCQIVTIPTGWKLFINAAGSITVQTAITGVDAAITDIGTTCGGVGTTVLDIRQIGPPTVGVTETFALTAVINGDGAAHAISLQALTGNAADAWTIINIGQPGSMAKMVLMLTPSN